MYDILIVDDSSLDVECIVFLISQYQLPLSPTTVFHGQEALNLIQEREKPFDILFTDIRMPFMDGLELSRAVRKHSPQTKIIMFSGFSDFEYAKSAISIGVEDYLMKPIIPEDFCATMKKVIESISKMRAEEAVQQKQMAYWKNHMLWRAVHHKTAVAELADVSGFSGYAELESAYTAMMLIECDSDFFSSRDPHFQDLLHELLPFSFDYLNLYPTRSLLFIPHSFTGTDLSSDLPAGAQAIFQAVMDSYHFKCSLTFLMIENAQSLYEAYQELDKLMEERFFFPEKNIFFPAAPASAAGQSNIISMDILAEDLRYKNYPSLKIHLSEIFDSLKNDQSQSMIYVKYCFTELTKLLLPHLPPNERFALDFLAEKIYNAVNITALIDLVWELYEKLADSSSGGSKDTVKIDKIRQYIYQNYARPLTLQEIADHFYISPNYLCSVFKKETGMNLNKFINDYRLQQAGRLLRTSEMKIYMIAESVGFANTSYFCQRFRDHYGESPEHYRLREGTL